MSKRVKRNTYLTYGHKFADAGPIDMNFGSAMKGAFGGSGAGAIGAAAGDLIGGAISGGYQSGAGDVFNKIGDIGSKIPGPWGAIIGGGAKVLGGVVNAAFGSKVDQEKLNAANEGTATLNSFKSNAESFDDIKGPAAVANVQDAYKGGWFAKGSARRKNEELRRQRAQAMSFADRSVENNVENLAEDQMNDMLSTYAAFGGPLHTNGADWTNGVSFVSAGGSHESNPLEGVPMGMAPDGTPNLVEEGEVIFNDYVFSKRLRVPKAVREKYKLRGTKDLTFADAAKKAQKESEERPNDPISKRGLEAAMQGLMVEQESVRQKKAERESKKAVFAYGGNLFACGGKFGHKYQGKGTQSQQMFTTDTTYGSPIELSARNLYGYGLDTGGVDTIQYEEKATTATNTNVGTTAASVTTPSNTVTPTPKKRATTKATPKVTPTTTSTTQTEQTVIPVTTPITPVYGGESSVFKEQSGYNPWTYGLQEGIPQVTQEPLSSLEQIAKDKTANRPDGRTVRVTDNGTNLDLVPKSDVEELDLTGPVHPQRDGNGWWDASYLRYAPALGAGIGALTDALGLTNVPDYSDAEAIKAAADSLRDVSYTPIGDYMKYTPFDRMFYANQLGAQAGATRRNIMNTSGGNRGVAMAGLLGADYNAGNQLGNLYRQAEEYNLGQRQKVAEFNRGTNQFNAENDLKAQIANIDNNSNKVKAAIAAAELKDKINARTSAARSANLTNLFDSIGDIGREAYSRNTIKSVYPYWIDDKGRVHYYNEGKAKGGFITIKSRRRNK